MEKDDRLPLILAENLGVCYEEARKKSDDFKSHTHNFINSIISKKGRSGKEPFFALEAVSFAGYPGDVLGVIGANGAGKTTLCRTVLGMIRPNMGHIVVNGEVSSLLSLGAGFNPQLSGRDNIYLNGMMLGMSRKKIDRLFSGIEEFAELDSKFRNLPLKHYSNGMKARLGFSIAAALEADIMIIDEVLGAGDIYFQKKAAARMTELVSAARMVMVVTHSIAFVEEHCNRALWIEKGRVAASGRSEEVAAAYRDFSAGKDLPRKKRILSLTETRSLAGSRETIDVNGLGVCFRIDKKKFWALDDVSFKVYNREILGIIGANGAGKTTLCRTLCGLYRGDRGTVNVEGTVTALLSLGAGFDLQLPGLENIYLNAMMLGIPLDEVRKIKEAIIRFAELEKHMRKPVKYYSKGMRTRLGFSIAAMLNPDILVIDEALSAGDIAFQEKAGQRMQELLDEASSVVIVSHNMKVIEKLCTRVIWLHQGKVRYNGDPAEAIARYREEVL